MTVCKQLNYLYRETGKCGDYSEKLVLDGEIGGRNWSLIERVWHRDAELRGGKFQYVMRIDISEYRDGYDKVFYSTTDDERAAMLSVSAPAIGNVRFQVRNRSPGIWENGFNPNCWLEAKIGAYADDLDMLRKIVGSGRDLRDADGVAALAVDLLAKLAPFMKTLRDAAPPGIPYHYWWGAEEPPPPRKPVY